MAGEVSYYTVDEAARLLHLTPERVREMAVEGELASLPPGATGGDWKVLLSVAQIPEQPLASEPAEHAESTTVAPDDEPPETDPAPMQDETTQTPDVPTEDPDGHPQVAEAARQPGEEVRGDDAASIREPTSESGWVTTQQAARALGISARTVRWHIERGNLDAKPEGEGVERTWRVSVDSLQAFRDSRQAATSSPRSSRASVIGADIAAEIPGSAFRELADRLVEEARRAEAARVRLELAERAQSSLEAELSEERRRREVAERELEHAQRERAELRLRLEASTEASGAPERGAEPGGAEAAREDAPESLPSPGPTGSPPAERGVRESATVEPGRAQPRSSTPTTQKATLRRSLWRRLVGG